jgi:hypothetical protein
MMAVCERAVKVMAALERRVPSLDDFVGQSWSAWAERAGVTASEGKGAPLESVLSDIKSIGHSVEVYFRGNGRQP